MQTLSIYSTDLSGVYLDESYIIHSKGAFIRQLIYNISPTSKLHTDICIGVKRCRAPYLSIKQIKDILIDIRVEKGVSVAEIVRQIIIADGVVQKATGFPREDHGGGSKGGDGGGRGGGLIKSMLNFGKNK